MPIDEYAIREGLSREIVEECGRFGIVQIRRYKGNTFVVDVPWNHHASETEITEEMAGLPKGSSYTKKMFELAKKVVCGTNKTPDEFADSYDQTFNKTNEDAQIRAKHTWQTFAVSSFIFLFTVLAGLIWFSMDRKIQLDRFNSAQANIRMIHNNFIQAKGQTETIQKDMDNSKAQLKSIQDELARTKLDLKNTQQSNAYLVDQLNKKIQRLTVLLINEISKDPQDVPDTSNPQQ